MGLNKKARLRFWYSKTSASEGGAGGVRTLVQTTSFQAFYMLIPRLIFDPGTDKNTQNLNLGTEFRICLVPSQTLAQWDELSSGKSIRRRSTESTCPTYCASVGLSQLTFS